MARSFLLFLLLLLLLLLLSGLQSAGFLLGFSGGLNSWLFCDYHFFFRVLLEFFFLFLLEFFFLLQSLGCFLTVGAVTSVPSEPVVHGHQLCCVLESFPVHLVRDHDRNLLQLITLFRVYLKRFLLPVESLDQSFPISFVLPHQSFCVVDLHLPTQFWATLAYELIPVVSFSVSVFVFVELVLFLVEVFLLHWVVLGHLLLDADHSLQYH